jgi:hypothetical protein
MQRIAKSQSLASLGVAMVMVLLPTPMLFAGKCLDCRKAAADMAVSLAVGSVRTPEFSVKHERYLIWLQAERKIPFGQMQCMMGIHLKRDPDHCEMFKFDTVLEAKWVVRDGDRIIAEGVVSGKDDQFESSDQYLSRYFGSFMGEAGRKYVLEVTFTKDGTALEGTNPHLIVMMSKSTDI